MCTRLFLFPWLALVLSQYITTGICSNNLIYLPVGVDYFSPQWKEGGLGSIEANGDQHTIVFEDGTRLENVTNIVNGLHMHQFMFEHNGVIHVYSAESGYLKLPIEIDESRHRRETVGFCSVGIFKTPRCKVNDQDIYNILYTAFSAVNPHIYPAQLSIAMPDVVLLPDNPTTRSSTASIDQVNSAIVTMMHGKLPCSNIVFDAPNTMDNNAVGVAYIGGACNRFLLRSSIVTVESYVQAVITTIHEIGHLLGLEHVDTATVMNGQIEASAGSFSDESIKTIGKWHETATCLSNTANITIESKSTDAESPLLDQIACITVTIIAVFILSLVSSKNNR